MADIDFAGLEVLNQNRKTQRASTNQSNRRAFELSDALDQANVDIIGINARHHEETTLRLQESDTLMGESDNIQQDIRRAEADPWHGLKVLFTDEKSVQDLAADQNLVQNNMNRISRQNQQGIYKYQFDLQQVQNALSFANEKRKNALFDVQATQQQAAASVAQMQAKRIFFDEQLNAMSYEQLIQLRTDVTEGKRSDFNDFSVEMKIREWEELINKSRSAGSKNILKLADDWAEFIPPAELNSSIRQNKGDLLFKIPGTEMEITYSRPMQIKAQAKQEALVAERATTATSVVNNVTDPTLQRKHFENMMMRYMSTNPAVDLFTVDQHGATVLDFAALPGGSPELIANLTGVDSAIQAEWRVIRGEDQDTKPGGVTEGLGASKPDDQTTREALAKIQVLGAKRQQLYVEMQKSVITEAQKSYATDSGKQTVADYIRTGRVNPNTAETRVALSESFVNNIALGGAYDGLGVGFHEMSTTLSASTKDEYRKAAEGSGDEIFKAFNSDDEGVREGAMAALMNTAPKLKVSEIQMRALQTSDANGINIHQTAAITAWNKDALRQAFEELKSRHANEPATMSTLEPFMTARNRGKIQPRYVNNDSGMLDLMTDLSNRSFLMHQQNSLDASQNLARELYEILQSPEFYSSPGILNMMKPKDMTSAMMTAELFNGNHAEAFQSSLRYNMGQLAIGDLTRTPAYDKEQDLHRMAQDIMKQSGVSVTDEAAFNDILHGLILQRRNKNPLRPKAINTRGRSQSRAAGRSANANRNRGQ